MLNKKRVVAVIIITLAIFVSFPVNADYNHISKKCACCTLIVIPVAWFLSYLFYPYKDTTPPPGVLSSELQKLYKDPIVNSKKYDEIPSVATHNSHTFPETTIDLLSPQGIPYQNQLQNVNDQLLYGIRTFLIDIYSDSDPKAPIMLAHGTYGYKREWSDFLSKIEQFLSTNSSEIITLHLESYVGNYSKLYRDLNNANLSKYLYLFVNGSTNWDTRANMIYNNQRLMIFSDNDADFGTGIMIAKYHVIENNYKNEQCEFRIGRLRLSPLTGSPIPLRRNILQDLKTILSHTGFELNNNRGAIVFLMNHFHTTYNALFKLGLPFLSGREIKDYYSYLNSYKRIGERIKKCYCEMYADFSIGGKFPVALDAYPSIIAIDFAGYETDEGVRGIVRDIILGNFTTPIC